MIEKKDNTFYISGPISGIPDNNAPMFDKAEKMLKAALLPSWEESNGSTLEFDVAEGCGCKLRNFTMWRYRSLYAQRKRRGCCQQNQRGDCQSKRRV